MHHASMTPVQGLSSEAGLTLVEVVVVFAIIGGLSLAVAQLMQNLNDGQARAQQVANINDLITLVTNTIRTDGGCGNTLVGKAIPTAEPANPTDATVITSIKDSAGTTVINGVGGGAPFDGAFPGGSGLARLTDIRFQLWSNTANVSGASKQAWVRIHYTKRFANGSALATAKDLPVSVVPDAAGSVTRCYGAGAAEFCSAVGGVFNGATGLCDKINLFPPGSDISTSNNISAGNNALITGRVGVGTTAPAAAVDLANGSLFAGDGSVANPSMTFGANSNTGLYRSAANALGVAANGASVCSLSSAGMAMATGDAPFLRNAGGSAAAPNISFGTSNTTGLFPAGGGDLGISTSGTEKVRVTSAGRVGIGISNPQATLDVAGGIRPGSSAVVGACNSSNEGTIRYVPGDGVTPTQIQVCTRQAGLNYNWVTGMGGNTINEVQLVRWAGPDGDTVSAVPPTCPAGWTLVNWVPVSSYDNWTTVGVCAR